MGELTENTHTFMVPDGDPYTFMMKSQCATDMVIEIELQFCNIEDLVNIDNDESEQ